jgi:hypothetical protein
VIEDSIFSLMQSAQVYTESVRAPPGPKTILNTTADQPMMDKSQDSDAKAIDNLMADVLGVTLAVAFMV